MPKSWIGDRLEAASFDTRRVDGVWRHGGVTYRDDLVRVVLDVPDTSGNRRWVTNYRERWSTRLGLLELWVICHPIVLVPKAAPTALRVDLKERGKGVMHAMSETGNRPVRPPAITRAI